MQIHFALQLLNPFFMPLHLNTIYRARWLSSKLNRIKLGKICSAEKRKKFSRLFKVYWLGDYI